METYNIIINSLTKIAGTNYSNYEYTYDWGLIPEGKYEMTFSFTSAATTDNTLLTILIPDLGATMNNFTTATNTGGNYANMLGTVTNINSLYYKSCVNENPPIYLNNRPMNSRFSVYVLDNTGTFKNIAVAYILILSLKKI